MQKPTVSKT